MSFPMMRRRSVLIGLAAASTLPALGFAQSGEPRPGGTLKISHSTRIASLNVLTLAGPAEYPCIDMLYSGLTRIGPDTRPMADLAESWQANEDATEFTFTLRPNVVFHDGTALTADDVVATYEAILVPDSPAVARSALTMVEAVEAVDDETVRFRLNSPYADLASATAHMNARILSRKALEGPPEALETTANGTGPFKLESFNSATVVRLVRNEDYFIAGRPYLDAVEMHLFPDLAAETTNFLRGDVDAMLAVQQADYSRIAETPGIKALRLPAGRFLNLVMRQDQKPFDDVRVRQALAMSVDRGLMVDLVLDGLGRPSSDNLFPPEMPYAIESEIIPYDPAGAKALLAEAGYADGLDVTLVASNRPAIRAQLAIALKQMAEPAGFRIEVEVMPHDTYLATVAMQGQFYVAYWSVQSTIDATVTLLLTSDAPEGASVWNNTEFDQLVARGRSTLDEAERTQIYAEVQELIVRDRPYLIPMFFDVLTASRDDVQGWTVNPIEGYYYIEDVWLDRS